MERVAYRTQLRLGSLNVTNQTGREAPSDELDVRLVGYSDWYFSFDFPSQDGVERELPSIRKPVTSRLERGYF